MNHIEEQINDCVAGLEAQIRNIEEIGKTYRLTPAEIKLVFVLRSMIDELKEERRKNYELLKEHGRTGWPLESAAA